MALSVGQWASNHYFDRHFQRNATKILPGEYFVTREAQVIVTVLGSCVAACLQDLKAGIGGMNHFLLPQSSEDDESRSARYGAYAMELLINEMITMGARKEHMQAKVFGGGHVIEGMSRNWVGQRNADFVKLYMMREGIPIVASDLLGENARKVYFFPDSGQVLVKKIRTLKNDTIMLREKLLRERITRERDSGTVELFGEL